MLFSTVTHAVILAGMARFPVQQCGGVPSSTLAEARIILQALIHITRRLPPVPAHTTRIHTDSKSSTQGSERLHNSTTAQGYLHDKFSAQWDLAQHLIHELSPYSPGLFPPHHPLDPPRNCALSLIRNALPRQ